MSTAIVRGIDRNALATDVERNAFDILRFNHAGGRVVAGLTRRRNAERTLFLT